MHTMKDQLIILPNGSDIVDVLIGEPGPTSDINLFQKREFSFEKEQNFGILCKIEEIK